MAATGVDSLYGKVASAALRWKITSLSPCVSTVSMVDSRAKTPLSPSREMARSMEYFTSCAVIGSPLENFRPSRRVQL
ncbi:hypothetical protein SALBM217S_10382 [Streptomyces griseoloalbus]